MNAFIFPRKAQGPFELLDLEPGDAVLPVYFQSVALPGARPDVSEADPAWLLADYETVRLVIETFSVSQYVRVSPVVVALLPVADGSGRTEAVVIL